MKRISANKLNFQEPEQSATRNGKIKLPKFWLEAVGAFVPGKAVDVLRPVQFAALAENKFLEHRRNLIVSAPTNSGKSLVGWLALLEAVRAGRRAVWLAPMRALAREKAEEIRSVSAKLENFLGKKLNVHLTTGDYRIEHEFFAAPPPAQGEIIIATPERLEAVMRNPEYQNWMATIGAVCVDEAHLLSSGRRGLTLEYVLTSLLCQPAPPRFVLLSASLGKTEKAEKWLAPCDTIRQERRHPTLSKEVWKLEDGEEPDAVITNHLRDALLDPEAQALIFVYQRRSAEKLAKLLTEKLSDGHPEVKVKAFHSQISSDERERVRIEFLNGNCRCLVATSALSLGLNLPASHVVIRDRIFPGGDAGDGGRLSTAELLQMMGRAGRGDKSGNSVVLVKNDDYESLEKAEELALNLSEEILPELSSAFAAKLVRTYGFKEEGAQAATISVAEILASLLARHSKTGLAAGEIQMFFERSLGGTTECESPQIPQALEWLQNPARLLAHLNPQDEKIRLTVLGQKSALASLPLPVAGGIGQLYRDLLAIDPEDQILDAFRPLDFLFLLHLFGYGKSVRKQFSRKLVEQVDGWTERRPQEIPVLFREWGRQSGIASSQSEGIGENIADRSKAEELLGSLGIDLPLKSNAHQHVYLSMMKAILLWERGQGASTSDLERIWNVQNLTGIEERWRDEMLWLLIGFLSVLEVRCFFFFLKEEAGAGQKRLKRLSQIYARQKQQIYGLLEHLKYCSPLGTLLWQLKQNKTTGFRGIGIRSIRKLEESGVKTLSELAVLTSKEMAVLGLRPKTAEQLKSYLRRRLM